jgi:hypothetical protein
MSDARYPVLQAAEPSRFGTEAERDRALQLACRDAMAILASSPAGARRLSHVDPLPESTVRILRDLAERSRAASGS